MIRLALEKDKNEILALYKAQLGQEYCPWNEYYPDMENIEQDLAICGLFVMWKDNRIVSAISIEHDEESDSLPCWSKELLPSGELARVCVLPEYQNQGIAREMMLFGMKELKRLGYRGIHILVNSKNIKALKSYAKLGFSSVGECDMYNQHFLCYEKEL